MLDGTLNGTEGPPGGCRIQFFLAGAWRCQAEFLDREILLTFSQVSTATRKPWQ